MAGKPFVKSTHPDDKLQASKTPVFDAARRYRFTWPGQEPREVKGDELTALCKGAAHEMLDIVCLDEPTAPELAHVEHDELDEPGHEGMVLR